MLPVQLANVLWDYFTWDSVSAHSSCPTTQLLTCCACSQQEAMHAVDKAAYHTCGQQGTPVVGVEDPNQSQHEDGNGHDQDLGAGPHTGTEKGQLWWEPEHISMDVFPASLFFLSPYTTELLGTCCTDSPCQAHPSDLRRCMRCMMEWHFLDAGPSGKCGMSRFG